MTADQHIEETLNRAGGTISDLPGRRSPIDYAYDHDRRRNAKRFSYWWGFDKRYAGQDHVDAQADYICHLTDIIDRYDEALTRLCDLRDRHVHIVGNVDPPDGVTQEQLCACVEAIIDATEKYRAGLEPWDDWSKNDDDK